MCVCDKNVLINASKKLILIANSILRDILNKLVLEFI